jgi:uracil-DNA glycosylase
MPPTTKPIILLGEAQGESEAKLGQSFVGASGVELLRMLGNAGVIDLSGFDHEYISRYYTTGDSACLAAVWDLHPEVFRTNVFQQHPPRNDLEYFCGPRNVALLGYPPLLKSKYVRGEFAHELDRLADEIVSQDPNLIICLGNSAMWALAGRTGITKLRGTTLLSTHTVLDFKLLPTYHPAAVLRQWEQRPTVIADLMKAQREAQFPEIRRPPREIWIEPELSDIIEFIDRYINGCCILSVDIETAGSRVTCIGFAPRPDVAIVIPFDDERQPGGSYWPTRAAEIECWGVVRRVLEDRSIPKLFQNGLYDIAFLLRAYGIRVANASEDTMLLHHALQPESLKGLGYLGSIYSDEGTWKGMRKKEKTVKKDS